MTFITTSHKKKQTPASSSTLPHLSRYAIILLSVVLLLCITTLYIVHQKNNTLLRTVNDTLNTQHHAVETMVNETLSDMTVDIKKDYLKDRTYLINKLNTMGKKIDAQQEKLTSQAYTISGLVTYKTHVAKQLETFQTSLNPTTMALPVSLDVQPDYTTYTDIPSRPSERRTAASRLLDRMQRKKSNRSVQTNKKVLYANAYAKMGWTYTQKGQFGKAIAQYKHAIALDPFTGMPYYNIACAYATLKQHNKALLWLKKGRPYFDETILETAAYDPDLKEVRKDPYFSLLMSTH